MRYHVVWTQKETPENRTILVGFNGLIKLKFVFTTASLPPQIGSLQRLETLLIEHNRITSLPPTVEGLKSLRHISLAYNDITAFPGQLCAIRTLNVIDLSHNKLTGIPDAVQDLNAIELNVNQNQVKC